MIDFEDAEFRARILKTIAHPVRIIIVDMLKDKELGFSQIKKNFSLDKSTISKHLSALKDMNIISVKKRGKETIYKLEIPCVIDFLECSLKVIKHNMLRHQKIVDSSCDRKDS